jgi:hypothetical protein
LNQEGAKMERGRGRIKNHEFSQKKGGFGRECWKTEIGKEKEKIQTERED